MSKPEPLGTCEDIGVPNVPAIVWEYEKQKARRRLDAGLCPDHNIPMIDTGKEEICPECEEARWQE